MAEEIRLRTPSKYSVSSSSPSISSTSTPPPPPPPSLSWLLRTWSVTDSTLAMWRNARNVRITYIALPGNSSGAARVDDVVEYEALNGKGGVKSVKGIDTAASPPEATATTGTAGGGKEEGGEEQRVAEWDWRGKSWLFFVSSHWEVLGWGEERITVKSKNEGGEEVEEEATERWVVTWFAPTVFTKEGVDFYCDRREGLSEGTRERLMEAFKREFGEKEGKKEVWSMVERDMRGVKVELPWKET
ncbi:hypothetical protein MKZ38_003054 [Zalerion maritima]|uniref:Uncharacterized protein n=1 Tax=Zalerion maritima TaxID=339359 RepID=A0AAD5WSL2_9PEZI|nr:hypothetical protein MKZ38_003054 [Zalerion maritima]